MIRVRRMCGAAVVVVLCVALPTLAPAAGAGGHQSNHAGSRVLPFTVVATRAGPGVVPIGPGASDAQMPRLRIEDKGDVVDLTAQTGPYPSTGYSVRVEQVALTEGGWSVVVRVISPPLGSTTGAAITSAYQTVRVERTLVGDEIPQSWSLVDPDGHLLAKSRDACSAGECYYPGQEPPRAGHLFTAYVLVRSEEARSRYDSIETECTGAIFNKRGTRMLRTVADTLTRLPQGASVPAVEVLMFKIPKRAGRPSFRTVAKRFGWTCSGTAVRVEPDGTRSVSHGDGALVPRWTILP
jgi:hypothetical protein